MVTLCSFTSCSSDIASESSNTFSTETAEDQTPKETAEKNTIEPSFVADAIEEDENAKKIENWTVDITYFENQMASYTRKFLDIENSKENLEISKKVDIAFDRLYADLPELDDFDIQVRMQQITALFQDGHMFTEIAVGMSSGTRFPFSFQTFADGVYCTVVYDKSYEKALNCRLDKINGVSIDEVFNRFYRLYSGDNLYNSRSLFGSKLYYPMILKALDLMENLEASVNYTFTSLDDNTFGIYVYKQIAIDKLPEAIESRSEGAEAFYNSKSEPIWLDYLEDKKALYLRLYYIPSSSEGKDLEERLASFIDKYSVEKIILDLRENGGGQFTALKNGWVEMLVSFGLKTKCLYVITDYSTFSMAGTTAMYLKDEAGATVVGLPPGGGKPYIGSGQRTSLRNSNFVMWIPTLNSYDNNLGYKPKSLVNHTLYPDIEISISIEDYINKTDPVLNLILSL
jgi:hypothetical protein